MRIKGLLLLEGKVELKFSTLSGLRGMACLRIKIPFVIRMLKS